ncbi:hypothetical protein GCM10022378_21270 [Salinicoccus jeotgali]|uniref:ABC transporter permease n=1 Tax=Salinicoccus jeotgali TaxID=381634 RepID=A0ABP7F820_9STAP
MDKVKLATADFSKEMAKWAAWYMAVMVALYILLMLFIDDSGINGMSFFFMASGANRVFMLVAGILTVFVFLERAIQLGLTRMTFMRAVLWTGVIFTVTLALVAGIISLILGVMPWFGTQTTASGMGGPVSMVLGHLLAAYLFYLAGFIISIGFYRGWFGGLIAIVLGVGIAVAIESLWTFRTEGVLFELNMISGASGNIFLTVVFSGLLILFTIALIQSLIRSLPIKIK